MMIGREVVTDSLGHEIPEEKLDKRQEEIGQVMDLLWMHQDVILTADGNADGKSTFAKILRAEINSDRLIRSLRCVYTEVPQVGLEYRTSRGKTERGLDIVTYRELLTLDGLLIFDEVLTGCRLRLGGAQELYGVKPDLSCFGKALGGGMPIGAFGGPEVLMRHLFPIGKVYQAGTFSGNPVTMAGGIETVRLLSDPAIFSELEAKSTRFFDGLTQALSETKVPVNLQRAGSMFSIIFAGQPVKNFSDAQAVDCRAYARFFHYLLDHGVYMPPTAVDAACLSAAHTNEEIDFTIEVCREAFKEVF